MYPTVAYPLLTYSLPSSAQEPRRGNSMPKLTKRVIDSTKPSDHDAFQWDTELRGFGLRVKPTGVKSYIIQYRTMTGISRRVTIGQHGRLTPDEARRQAKIQLGRVARGDDPAAERAAARDGISFAAFAERYLSDHAATKKKPSSVRMDRINLQKHLLPILGRKRLDTIGRADVVRLHQSMHDTPGAANRCLALISKMMNVAERWGERPDGSNPCRHVEKYRENKRDRFLSAAELARLGAACRRCEQDGTIGRSFLALVRLLIFTGARLSEIQKAQWDWVDFDSGVLRLPDSKTGAKTIVLPAPALDVLSRLVRVDGNPYIIAGKGNRYLINVWKQWAILREVAELKNVRIHDLRHSFASIGAAGGMSLNIIGGLLGHKQAQTTSRYAHLAADPLKAAANRIAGLIAATMNQAHADAEVVSLKAKPQL
jgi:integrase